jgi:hypothetical protein
VVRGRWPELDPPYGADAAATMAIGQLLCDHTADAVELVSRALEHAEDGFFAPVTSRRVLGLAERLTGNPARAAAMLGEAASIAADIGLPTMDMECRVYQAQGVAALGRRDEALALMRAVAHRARDASSVLNEVWAWTVEGAVLSTTDPAASPPPARQALGDGIDDLLALAAQPVEVREAALAQLLARS